MIKLRRPETAGFDYPMTQGYIPEKFNPQTADSFRLLTYLHVLRPLQAPTMVHEMKI
jgi:hypothetical protein